MDTSFAEARAAVAAGYWHNFRFDPRLAADGKNPFTLDSKEPTTSYVDFISTETRYTSLKLSFPDMATKLFDEAGKIAKEKYEHLVRLSKLYDK